MSEGLTMAELARGGDERFPPKIGAPDTPYKLEFGPEKIRMTKFGERKVRQANPTEEFWAAWRADKDAVKRAGYSLSKNKMTGKWSVAVWKTVMSDDERQAAAASSRAQDAIIAVPVPDGRELFPFQKAGVAYALAHDNTLIADEMGLGKTVQAIAVANAISAKRVLVVCPASLLANWRNEIQRWQTLDLPVKVIRAGIALDVRPHQWVVINYDILSRYEQIKTMKWDLLISDECHYLKNAKAKRTKWIMGGGRGEEKVEPIGAKRKLLLTGTPICNRPAELFSLIHYLDPVRWDSYWSYAKRYCGAYETSFGLQAGGASNLDELQYLLRSTVMVRRLKMDVLTELPPKQRQIVLLEIDGAEEVIAREHEVYKRTSEAVTQAEARVAALRETKDESAYRAAVSQLQAARGIAFSEMARVRHEVALAKVPGVIEHLKETEGKVIVFAHHKDVVAKICAALAEQGVVSITGDTPNEQRQEAVDKFQSDPNTRIFVGNIKAAGVGLTLTASSHVVFAELDWVPGNVSQAEDRAHRIGQRNSVLVQHLVLDGSLDATMAQTIIDKQRVIEQALDDETAPIVYGEYEEKAEKPAKPEIPELSADQVAAIHEALRVVASYDGDNASFRNDIGFNGADTLFGCSLAARAMLTPRQAAIGKKIIRKYRRQYPKDLYVRIFGETWE